MSSPIHVIVYGYDEDTGLFTWRHSQSGYDWGYLTSHNGKYPHYIFRTLGWAQGQMTSRRFYRIMRLLAAQDNPKYTFTTRYIARIPTLIMANTLITSSGVSPGPDRLDA